MRPCRLKEKSSPSLPARTPGVVISRPTASTTQETVKSAESKPKPDTSCNSDDDRPKPVTDFGATLFPVFVPATDSPLHSQVRSHVTTKVVPANAFFLRVQVPNPGPTVTVGSLAQSFSEFKLEDQSQSVTGADIWLLGGVASRSPWYHGSYFECSPMDAEDARCFDVESLSGVQGHLRVSWRS